MSANSVIKVTELDFDTIKEGIKAYISSKQEFLDYNFEGSVINLLLDTLAYNTYQNAFYSNMIGNEMFLDSAILRDSVVSRAKMLGYTPRSARGASITLDITIVPNDSPTQITIPKNTQFTASLDGQTYIFVTPEEYNIEPVDSVYSGTITIVNGRPVTHRFAVSSTNPVRYIIPNKLIDTNSLTVKVQTSDVDTSTETYTLADDITEVLGTSPVFFLQEVNEEYYEIYFGDDVLGKKPVTGNIVILEYRICDGSILNDLSTFSYPSTIGGYSTFTIDVNDTTSGGANNETIESIKFNAPKSFETQNRAVLAEDYKRIILRDNGDIHSLRVWGGQENTPPVYGKVFISVKPTTSLLLSQSRKDVIKANLKKYNLMSVDVEFIDPTYIFIVPTIRVNYSSSLTTLTSAQIRNKVIAKIQAFENTNLGTFDNESFRFSKFVQTIDSADSSIINNTTTVKLQKTFNPTFNVSTKYTLNFKTDLLNVTEGFSSIIGIPANHPGGGVTVSSTAFTYGGNTCYLDDDGFGNVRLYYRTTNNSKAFVNERQGTVDYQTGMIILNSFTPASATDDKISVIVVPKVFDIIEDKQQLMLFGAYTITMVDEAQSTVSPAVTVSTTGSVLQINETAIGTLV